MAGCLPEKRLEIHIEITGDTSRRFPLRARAEALAGVLPELAKRLGLSTQ